MPPSLDQASSEELRTTVAQQQGQIRWLELRVKDLETQLYGQKSERRRGEPVEDRNLRWEELLAQVREIVPEVPPASVPPTQEATRRKGPSQKTGEKKGPKPLDPALPREVVAVPAPDLGALLCPVTKRPMQPAFVECLEVLARRPPVYYVKRYERTVFTSPAKTAPVYAPWPADVLPRARVHASIVAHVAAMHFCEHAPYHRLEKQLERLGVELPRVCQVSLMAQLDAMSTPLVEAIRAEVWRRGYIQLDATPIDLFDPTRPGAVRESTLWAYRAIDGPVWFDFQLHKSPTTPAERLEHYGGLLQTDGAPGLESIGQQGGRVTHLGCFSHARRYLVKAVDAKELIAAPYLRGLDQLFRLERLARHFKLSAERRQQLRSAHSLPLAEQLFADAATALKTAEPKTRFHQAMVYLQGQKDSLLRCLREPRARIDNNLVEQSVRPLKIGAKNWGQIGHPNAGPRLARLYTLIENCRLEGIDPEAYLVDIIARLPDHPMKRIAELLPSNWKAAQPATAAAVV